MREHESSRRIQRNRSSFTPKSRSDPARARNKTCRRFSRQRRDVGRLEFGLPADDHQIRVRLDPIRDLIEKAQAVQRRLIVLVSMRIVRRTRGIGREVAAYWIRLSARMAAAGPAGT